MTTDMVHSPPHYKTDSGLEAIDVIEAFFADNAHLANAFRYMSRLDKKWDGDEDLDKAIWYLQRLRDFRNGGSQESEPDAGDAPERVVYEFFGRVRNMEFTTTQNFAECEFDMLHTMLAPATHHVRFEFDPDGDTSVADLFIGKPTYAHRETAPLFRVGDRVRVIKNTSTEDDVPIGAIGKIQAGPDSDGDYEVKFEDDWHYFEPGEIEVADGPKAGDILTVTDTDGHNFPCGVQVKVDTPGGWVGLQPNRYVLCSRTDGTRTECGMKLQAVRLECTNW